jgi:hypothetical protein
VAALAEDVKTYIVQALACFDSVAQVVDDVKVDFGLVLDRRQVACYDPTLASGADLGKKLKAVFEATRKKFLEDVASVAATNRTVRMRRLERMSVLHRANPAMASLLLEQIAKEMGNVFTNKRQTEMSGPDGGPMEFAVPSPTTSRRRSWTRLEDVASVAATNRTVRMRRLERLSVLHRANPAMASHLLEQIAKEMGNVFTNKRQTEMSGPDGGPMEFSVPSLDHFKVVDDVKVDFGLVLDRRQVACHAPTLASGADLGKKLRAVFEAMAA